MVTIPHEPQPIAITLKSEAIFGSIAAGRSTIAAIADATGFPATTILRVAALLVEDQSVTAHVAGGDLCLAITGRGPLAGPA